MAPRGEERIWSGAGHKDSSSAVSAAQVRFFQGYRAILDSRRGYHENANY